MGPWRQPVTIRTANGPLVTLPYTVELNDIPMMIVQHHESGYFLQRAIDSFDRLYEEGLAAGQNHGDCHPSLYQRPTASHQIPRSHL